MAKVPKLIPAAAYIRMSSNKQEASPEQQRAEVAKLAASLRRRGKPGSMVAAAIANRWM